MLGIKVKIRGPLPAPTAAVLFSPGSWEDQLPCFTAEEFYPESAEELYPESAEESYPESVEEFFPESAEEFHPERRRWAGANARIPPTT